MNVFRLFWLQLRRLLFHPLFLLLLCLIPLAAFFGSLQEPADAAEDAVLIGYCICTPDLEECIDPSDTKDLLLLQENLNDADITFRFLHYDSIKELRAKTAAGELECAYLIPEDLFTGLVDNEKKNRVMVLSSPKSSMVPVVNESVYAEIFELLSGQILEKYLRERSALSDLIPDTISPEEIAALHEKYLTNGSTFHFEYEDAPTGYAPGKRNILLSPLRGLFAILILLAGFTGALSYYKAAEHPLYAGLPVRIVMILAPQFLCSLLALFCLYIIPDIPDVEKTLAGFLAEVLRLFLYQLLCLLFLLLLTSLIRSRTIIYAFMPVYLLACLVFSPVFLDLGQFIPLVDQLSWFFLPSYYLL